MILVSSKLTGRQTGAGEREAEGGRSAEIGGALLLLLCVMVPGAIAGAAATFMLLPGVLLLLMWPWPCSHEAIYLLSCQGKDKRQDGSFCLG